MGVYIKDLKKPKDCYECPIAKSYLDCLMEKKYVCPIGHTDDCPLIDIVTCGECKYWYNDADCGMACEFTNMKQPSDGFCNWGERATDE